MKQISVWSFGIDSENLERVEELENGSVNEIAEQLPEGVYTTIRTYHQDYVLYLNRHFDRLEESAKLAGVEISINRVSFRNKMRIAINQMNLLETRLRIHTSLLNENKGMTFLILEPLTIPSAEEVAKGVAIVTRSAQRINPSAKTTGFLTIADEMRKGLDAHVNEVLMISQAAECLEGLSSNFYGVDQKIVWTAEEGVLHGITRQIALDVMQDLNIQAKFRGFPYNTIYQLEEALITSTSRGVLPVTLIDNQKIGNGQPGPITEMIRKAFDEKINTLIEKI